MRELGYACLSQSPVSPRFATVEYLLFFFSEQRRCPDVFDAIASESVWTRRLWTVVRCRWPTAAEDRDVQTPRADAR